MVQFPRKTAISVEIRNFFTDPVRLTPTPKEFPFEFCNGNGAKKLTWCPYQNIKKCDDICINLDTIPALDGQTDRQIVKQYYAQYAMDADARYKTM